jgi:hypothetical protein
MVLTGDMNPNKRWDYVTDTQETCHVRQPAV